MLSQISLRVLQVVITSTATLEEAIMSGSDLEKKTSDLDISAGVAEKVKSCVHSMLEWNPHEKLTSYTQ